MLLRLGLLVLLLLAACKEKNSEYCQGHPDDVENCPPPDAGKCTRDDQCAGGVCDTTSSTCVQCTTEKAAACTGTTPVCSAEHTCQGCTAHAQCTASNACLPDGSCATDTQVAYVDSAGTDNTTCTKAMPCPLVKDALSTSRPYIKIAADGAALDSSTVTIDARAVTIVAEPGAKLDRNGDGAILEVRSANADVKIVDLEITGASGAAGADAILLTPNGGTPKLTLTRVKLTANQGAGISATGGILTITKSAISNNGAGGISLTATQFDITNSLIVQNGLPGSLIGGVNFATIGASGAHRLDFNTIAANNGTATVNTGVNCGTVAVPVTFSSNIIYGNTVASGGKQLGGSVNCSASYSDIGPDAVSGTGNISGDPLFVSPSTGNFHLQASSPARDTADPAATLETDVDGDLRPQGSSRDIGADEIK